MAQDRLLKLLFICLLATSLLTYNANAKQLNQYLASIKGKSSLQPSSFLEIQASVQGAGNCIANNWWGSFDFEGESSCTDNAVLSGFWRNNAPSTDSDYISNLEEGQCCNPNLVEVDTEYMEINSGKTGWWSCNPGFLLAGLIRDGSVRNPATDRLNNVKRLVCRRPKSSPKKDDPSCYDMDVSDSWVKRTAGWVTCDKPGFYLKGMNRPAADCNGLYCFSHFRCCPISQPDCGKNNGGCDALTACIDTDSGHRCGNCPNGYDGSGYDGCRDIDECASNNGGCDILTRCQNSPGSFKCADCPRGYSGIGLSGCVDVNECLLNNGGCDVLTRCVNFRGSRRCGDCPDGYSGSGDSGCKDVNECAMNNGGCDPLTKCTNTIGSRTCGPCPDGFRDDGFGKCIDIDECVSGNGGCDPLTTCQNTAGSRFCGPCPSGYNGTGVTGCNDIDECKTIKNGGCDPNSACLNKPGSYACGDCPIGFKGNGYVGCEDINECALNNGDCDPLVLCRNTPGSRVCDACPKGYRGDGTHCFDDNECAVNNGGCDTRTACKNIPGSRECGQCPRGYKGNGETTCQDVDECSLLPNGGCDPNARCINTMGSRNCGACPTGMIGSGYAKCFNDTYYIEDLMRQQQQKIAVDALEANLKVEIDAMLEKFRKMSQPLEDAGLINPMSLSNDQVSSMTKDIANQIVTEIANKYKKITPAPLSSSK